MRAVAILAVLVLARLAFADPEIPQPTGTLAGTVTDLDGAVLRRLRVVAEPQHVTGYTQGTRVTFSDDAGNYTFHGLATGSYVIRASYGYGSCEYVVSVFADATTWRSLIINPDPTRLEIEPAPLIKKQPRWLTWAVDLTTQAAVNASALDRAFVHLDARWDNPHDRGIGDSIVAIDADVGRDASGNVPYALSARLGAETPFEPCKLIESCHSSAAHLAGIVAGVAIDADGPRIPPAWLFPVDAHWYRQFGDDLFIGAVGGVSVRFAGADRPLGWHAGLDLFVTNAFTGVRHLIGPRNWHVGVGVERQGDVTFLGVTIGIRSAGRYDIEFAR